MPGAAGNERAPTAPRRAQRGHAAGPAEPQADGYGVLSTVASTNNAPAAWPAANARASDKETAVRNLIHAYRSRGRLRAKTNPVRERKDRQARLDLADFGLSDADLDTAFRQRRGAGPGPAGHAARHRGGAGKDLHRHASASSTCTSATRRCWSGFSEKVERDCAGLQPRRGVQEAHSEEAERGGGVRELPAHQVLGAEALFA
ncbi:MAG: hypothetical protein WKG07_18495 [Hymenobacter sp.]